jgi:hypothetical protein
MAYGLWGAFSEALAVANTRKNKAAIRNLMSILRVDI